MTNLDSIFKSRNITLSTKVHLVKVMVFPVVVYRCWTIKKAECHGTNASELWCWRRLLRVPWTARRSNQSILKEIKFWILTGRTDAEAETPILWLPDAKNCHWERPLCWERLKAGGEGNESGWDDWMASPTQWTWVWASSRRRWRTGKPDVLWSMGSQSQTGLRTENSPPVPCSIIDDSQEWKQLKYSAMDKETHTHAGNYLAMKKIKSCHLWQKRWNLKVSH